VSAGSGGGAVGGRVVGRALGGGALVGGALSDIGARGAFDLLQGPWPFRRPAWYVEKEDRVERAPPRAR